MLVISILYDRFSKTIDADENNGLFVALFASGKYKTLGVRGELSHGDD